ncbi:hypothetical protein OLX02_08500 [Novosphingobium sp. KCTC 2891]|uniref:hypothetical protein n=1 Tax=Novosphingobium sp. KCTC 2891 TaxID=2989730 RepID=UPI002222CB1F|nr:hypothetical protein [Novosphingobium sp. KCTC 2891]MCW1382862.1 hypothetical protein [Novosphingobium sp. KCTC 2891]
MPRSTALSSFTTSCAAALAALLPLAAKAQDSAAGITSAWDYVPAAPSAQTGPWAVGAPRVSVPAGFLTAVLTRPFAAALKPSPIPDFGTGRVAPSQASTASTVSITDNGLSGSLPAPAAWSPSSDIAGGGTPAPESTSGDNGFFGNTVLAVEVNAAQARRYLAAITPVLHTPYGIMTPAIAEEMLARADRLPGESPRGMSLAAVLGHNHLPDAVEVAPGRWVSDGTAVRGRPRNQAKTF